MVIAKLHNLSRVAVPAFFVFYFVIGLLAYNDYGISWDEPYSRKNGLVSCKFILQTFFPKRLERYPDIAAAPNLNEYVDRDYGVAFEVPLIIIEKAFGLGEEHSEEVYRLRHLCTFVFFFIAVSFFYLTALQQSGNRWMALLGCLMLVVSPRIFADSFYNDKDLALLSAFIIATYFLVRYLDRKTFNAAVWFAFTSAIAIDIRILGVVLPCVATGFVLWDLITRHRRQELVGIIGSYLLYLALTAGFVIAFCPYLWMHSIEHFLEIFHNMSKFRWVGSVLYMGERIPVTELPWHYIPVWIAITTPIMYLVLFVVGTARTLMNAVRSGWRLYLTPQQRNDLVFLSIFSLPIAAVIALHAVLYDAWRQMFFVYGAFIMLALVGIEQISHWTKSVRKSKRRGGVLMMTVLTVNLVTTLLFMVRYHPNQNVYFNSVAGKKVADRFELDYWGLSYRQALEYVVQHDQREKIRVMPHTYSCVENALILTSAQRKRIDFVYSDGDYYLTEFRYIDPQFRDIDPHAVPDLASLPEVYDLTVDGNKIVAVYKLK